MNLLKVLLSPLAFFYGLITAVRNYLYDSGLIESYSFPVNTIVVGNLSVGGTGKTPFVQLLASNLSQSQHTIAILSRGYGRKTTGFLEVNSSSSPEEAGDEALSIYLKLNEQVPVFVCENRVDGIRQILDKMPTVQTIILDDGFQHRRLKADINILLTTYQHPFYNDFLLPVGRLRERRSGVKRTDIIVVTKCPDTISQDIKEEVIRKIYRYAKKPVFFSRVEYGELQPINNQAPLQKVILVTGIAHSRPLYEHLSDRHEIVHHFNYPDHHSYSQKDMITISDRCKEASAMIITTEKDIVKIRQYQAVLKDIPVFVQPIENEILFQKKNELLEQISANQ